MNLVDVLLWGLVGFGVFGISAILISNYLISDTVTELDSGVAVLGDFDGRDIPVLDSQRLRRDTIISNEFVDVVTYTDESVVTHVETWDKQEYNQHPVVYTEVVSKDGTTYNLKTEIDTQETKDYTGTEEKGFLTGDAKSISFSVDSAKRKTREQLNADTEAITR